MSMRAAVVGATTWGLTLACLLERSGGFDIGVLTRSEEEARTLTRERASPRLKPGVQLPESIRFSHSQEEILKGAELALLCVPSRQMVSNLAATRSHYSPDMLLLSAAKGIEEDTGLTMSRVISRELPQVPAERVGAISGPNLAHELAEGFMAFTTVAFPNLDLARGLQKQLHSQNFRVYITDDLLGVEIGGAYKNIIAMSAGYVDALGVGSNSKAALVTRGLHEMTGYGVAAGARRETFAGLSGLGDLLATCYSDLSRNYRMGAAVAHGKSIEDAKGGIEAVVEGVPTTRAVVQHARKMGLELPVAEATYKVLYENASPLAVRDALLQRDPKTEASLSKFPDKPPDPR